MNLASLTFAAIAGTLLACYAFRTIARWLGQPGVIGELFGGVLLGPTLLGSFSATVLPETVRPQLSTLGNIGAALFMLVLGMDFGTEKPAQQLRRTGLIGIGSVLLPFALGTGLGGLLVAWGHGNSVVFVLFMGIAMSVTAFPVLAKLLEHRKMTNTGTGQLAIGAAAASDVLAWTVLAVIAALARTGSHTFWLTLLVIPLFLLLRFVVTPALRRLPGRPGFAVVLIAGGLACGAVTEAIGLHFIFGSFLFGAVIAPLMKSDTGTRDLISGIAALLLPVYFLSAGLKVTLSLSPATIGLIALALIVAIVGKMGGTYATARLVGVPQEQATTLAVLMNTRGLTELIVLTTGLELGILSTELYSIMVIVALVTTAVTNPALDLLAWRRRFRGADGLMPARSASRAGSAGRSRE
ncbi:cation:proton antiporter [Amycolatopsis sp. cg5]|uniref:cation:proton antiporter domain-containing protein n=1 Tax=Amycolatopsis sp. cg5 TaxID=3238802 RepID=UPI003525E2CC